MTNAELREKLDEFGDHLEVVVVIAGDEYDTTFSDFDIDTSGGVLAITVELNG